MQTVTFKAPAALIKKLEKYARSEERSKSHLVRKAVEAFVREMEEDAADYKLAMKRLQESDGVTHSWQEVKTMCGLK
ncbi:MAG: ribbon-helix-helix protein, CopG family [Rickettsiales bacterium]